MEKTYNVHWAMDIDAETPEEAAHKAWRFMRNDGSIATVFNVDGTKVDFDEVYPDGRPEDLSDLAPELVCLLEQAEGLMPLGTNKRAEWMRRSTRLLTRVITAKGAYR